MLGGANYIGNAWEERKGWTEMVVKEGKEGKEGCYGSVWEIGL